MVTAHGLLLWRLLPFPEEEKGLFWSLMLLKHWELWRSKLPTWFSKRQRHQQAVFPSCLVVTKN